MRKKPGLTALAIVMGLCIACPVTLFGRTTGESIGETARQPSSSHGKLSCIHSLLDIACRHKAPLNAR